MVAPGGWWPATEWPHGKVHGGLWGDPSSAHLPARRPEGVWTQTHRALGMVLKR